jgi:Holliday junction DNA helicase RuvB
MKEKVEVEAAAAIRAGDAGTRSLPRSFAEMIGQKELVRRLTGLVELARRRKEVLDHILLIGPDGCGKNTTAHTIARELGVNVRATEASRIERPGDLAAIIADLDAGDTLFIENISRLRKDLVDVLLPG